MLNYLQLLCYYMVSNYYYYYYSCFCHCYHLIDQEILSEHDRQCQNTLIDKYNEAITTQGEFSESVILFNLDKSRKGDQVRPTTRIL